MSDYIRIPNDGKNSWILANFAGAWLLVTHIAHESAVFSENSYFSKYQISFSSLPRAWKKGKWALKDEWDFYGTLKKLEELDYIEILEETAARKGSPPTFFKARISDKSGWKAISKGGH